MSGAGKLAGKVALVTGGSRGLGRGIAEGFAAEGAKVVVNYLRDEKAADAVVETIKKNGSEAIKHRADIGEVEDVTGMIDAAVKRFGTIDILVNNAGMQHRAPLEDFPAEAFERLLRTNISTVFNVAQACARHMISRGAGKIVNIASVQTALARPGIAPYTATKGAVGNLTKGMATDWARHGLQCNAIAPGYFDTPLNEALVADPEFSSWLAKRTPAGRWGKVEELIGACIFLSSDASSFVNGHILYVDGGITASL